MAQTNGNLHQAKKAKFDEFYTRFEDVVAELNGYWPDFEHRTVYCNCDDTGESAFWKYFQANFANMRLNRVIGTHYDRERPSYATVLDWAENADVWRSDPRFANRIVVDVAGTDRTVVLTTLRLNGNGDFRSRESVAFLDMSDIVCTNPPFSLFREYVAQIVEHGKGFLIMGNMNAVTYKEIFPLIKDGRLWAGSKFNKCFEYRVPDSYPLTGNKCRQDENGVKYVTVPAIAWYTNLDHPKRHRPLDLFRRYTPERYPEYDNYSAINVDKVADIPEDYMGPMGVPISFLDKWCPEQFEILGFWNAGTAGEALGARMTEAESGKRLIIWNGPTVARKTKYFRIIIRRVI